MKHLSVFEVGEVIHTITESGEITAWTVNAEGIPRRISERPIEELGLTVRTYNLLKREGVNTVGDLLDFHDGRGVNGMSEIRNFNKPSVDEVVRRVARIRAE
jgi:DNA-directed RNA polymerase alpha subunit